MEIVEITQYNLSEFAGILPSDMAENIGRACFHAIGITEDGQDTAKAALVWEIRNVEKQNTAQSELKCFYAKDEASGSPLLEKYSEMIAFSSETVDCSYYEFEGENELISRLMKQSGFEESVKESSKIEIKVAELKKLKLGKKKTPPHILSTNEIRGLKFCQGIANCMFRGKRGLLEDLDTLPEDWFEHDISSCTMTDGRIDGMFLVHKTPSGILRPVLLMCSGPDARENLLYMLKYTAEKTVMHYSDDTLIEVRCLHEYAKALVDNLFPDKHGEEIVYGIRRED